MQYITNALSVQKLFSPPLYVPDMWLFVIASRQTVFENKLNPVKQQTAEVNRRTWKTLLQCSDNETAAPAGHLQGVSQSQRMQ